MKAIAIFEGGLSFWHVLIILGIGLLLFGTKKLPDIGRSLGRGIKEFKSGIQGLSDDVREGLQDDKNQKPKAEAAEPKAEKNE